MTTNETDVVFGRWPVREILERGRVYRVLLAKGTQGGPVDEVLKVARVKKIMCDWVDRRKLDQLCQTEAHQGIVALVPRFEFANLADVLKEAKNSSARGARLLFLDGIMDPQNLGSLLRSAVFFGVSGVVIPKWRAASVTAAVVRASAGAARLLPVVQVANIVTAMEAARKAGFWLIGADMNGKNAKTFDVPRPFALVMGSEGDGLHELVRRSCDEIVAIARVGDSDAIASLNVGVAGGILLHQFS